MRVDVDARCDIGCVRANNEDLILAGSQLLRDATLAARLDAAEHHGHLLLAVADGMGGAAAGELASEIALTQLRTLMQAAPAELDGDELSGVLPMWAHRTHAELLAQGQACPQRAGMGTTVVGLLLWQGRAWRFHAGDSRLYRRRAGRLERLTEDHSLRQQTGDASLPGNLLFNALGGGAACRLELAEIADGVQPFDRFLLCSDGLHEMVNDADIEQALAGDRETAVQTLVQLARQAGGLDNISVLVADIPRPAPSDLQIPTRP
ncbi:protein phosphatase 2C domain-containing protein [Pelomonas sp. CA6]|uniref:PP2C family protein-serine/threonine phosphatase n=1 Tax=Pelomonas sp. CA6 TaxID=2907999 RepID=UPI001F4AB576|nr:protein phosphatase 2C domain-containing protein [Pelomonas sp. CA6]MCH7342261.1 protein phosphatase 2C domain-containing protein [Pelomonas sp. CA6]